MAKYYGVLPSVVIEQGSTFDLMVYDVSVTWEQHQYDKANGKSTVPNISQEELLKIIQETKGGRSNGR